MMRLLSNTLCIALIFFTIGSVSCDSSKTFDSPNAVDSPDDRSLLISKTGIAAKLPDERQFFTSNALNFGSNGATSVTIGNAGYVVLGAYILVPLIIGLALLFYLIGGYGDRGGHGGGESYGSTGSSYGSYARFVVYSSIDIK